MGWGTTPTPPHSGGNGAARIKSPAELRQAGNNSLEIAGELHTKGRGAKDETAHAAADFKNASWNGRLGKALDQTVDIWDDQVARLVRTLREIHSKCTNTAENYERTEAENAEKFTSTPKTPFG